jgi:demethylmenaquinone methyltransferase/2-methoxy-6-polyprenyl-1,4-benzoquinol methylase
LKNVCKKSACDIDHKKRDARKIEEMFSRIASRYDLLNHVLSLGLDIGWRKKVARETGEFKCNRVLDVCTGTGDMAIELCRFWKGTARVEGLDFSPALIEIGKKKVKKANLEDRISFSEGNAEKLPFENDRFDAVTITFGLRNIDNRLKALREFYRVTASGGRFVCLEFSQPTNKVLKNVYSFYLFKVAPLVSKILGSDPAAYRYLGYTIRDFPSSSELTNLLESAGWKEVSCRKLAGGIVAIHRGTK